MKITDTRAYSYALVSVQFICICLLIFTNKSMFKEIETLFLAFLALGILFSILSHSKSTNFNIVPEIKEGANLVQTGVYKYVRHPMYLAVLILALAPLIHAFVWENILLFILLAIALFLKMKKEEYLWSKKSQKYKEYAQNTKMIIPFIL